MSLAQRPDAKYYEVHYGEDLKGTEYADDGIIFKTAINAPADMPGEPLALKSKVEYTASQVMAILVDPNRYNKHLIAIGNIARVGLEDAQLNVSTEGLSTFQKRFAETEGVLLRGNYIRSMVRLGRWIGIPSIAFAVVASTLLSIYSDSSAIKGIPNLKENLQIGVSCFYILAGISLGATLSAFTRNRSVTFENLVFFDQDRLDPTLRYTFLVVVAAVLAVLLYKGWLVAGIAKDLLLNNFSTDFTTAIILGILTGFAEANVTRLISGGLDTVKDWRAPKT